MNRRLRLFLFSLVASAVSAAANPMTIKELDLLVRMHTPENQIMDDISKRLLLAPLDDAGAKKLAEDGASPTFIEKIKNGNFVLAENEAAKLKLEEESRREVEKAKLDREAARHAAYIASLPRAQAQSPDPRMPQTPAVNIPTTKLAEALEGKLVHMDGGALRPISAGDLRDMKYFVLYFSAGWCAPCRHFSPQLVNFYNRSKGIRSNFEFIFVSADKSQVGMEQYMKDEGMTWPAVRFDLGAAFAGYGIGTIPFVLVVDEFGRPVYPIDPGTGQIRKGTTASIAELEQFLNR